MAAPVRLTTDDHGVLTIADDQPIAEVALYVHDTKWGMFHQRAANMARSSPERLEGAIELGGEARGELKFVQTVAGRPPRADVEYALTFIEETRVTGAYVSVHVPVARFAGRTVSFPDGAAEFTLREQQGGATDRTTSAFLLPLDDERCFVVASDAAGQLHIQDNRQFGSETFEFRFVLAQGRLPAGHAINRRFVLAATAAEAAAQLARELNPPRHFDRRKPHALVSDTGEVEFRAGDTRLMAAHLAIHGLEWAYAAQGAAKDVASAGDSRQRTIAGQLDVPGATGKVMEFAQTFRDPRDKGLDIDLHLRFPEAVRLNGYQLSFTVPANTWTGREIELIGEQTQTVSPPVEYGDQMILAHAEIRQIRLGGTDADAISISVDPPSPCLVQDNREFGGGDLELRFNFLRAETGEEVSAGETVDRTFGIRFAEPLYVVLNDAAERVATDTTDWFPFSLPWDRAALDLSFLNHKPAGRHGFLTVKGDQFVFEDGTPVRFWGTCFSAGANFPTHEQAERIAGRLAAYGVNIVRTHHADASWAERHFFYRDRDNTQEFDPESLDRFDYLIHCLKQQGIYVYLDQLVNRRFKSGDGVDAVEELPTCGKPYSNFDPRLIELQKKFSHDLWTHVNPYTKLAYKDDPAIALMEFANENDLFTQSITLEPYRSRLETQYRKWARGQGIEVPQDPVSFRLDSEEKIRFLVEVQAGFYREMAQYLRSIGVRTPMTGSNWSRNLALLASLQVCDYTDSHSYWDHPQNDRMNNRPMVRSPQNVFSSLSFNRLAGRPFFVSEWDQPWPNEWRAEHALAMAAVAALQGWNGLTTYTYRHSSNVPCDHLSGAFETFNDPARFGLFYHAALIYRRGDVAPARRSVAVLFPGETMYSAPNPSPWGLPVLARRPEVSRLAMALADRPTGVDDVVAPDADASEAGQVEARSDTGQLYRNWEQGYGTIDTPRTQAAYGFVGEQPTIALADLELRIDTPFATVALSSLSDDPIRSSRRMLLTAVGRAENTGTSYNVTRNRLLGRGRGPILVEPIRAVASIRTDIAQLKVRPVAPDGTRGRPIPAAYRDGRLEFRIGDHRTMHYELTE
jgi:hypothetical protein